MKKKRLLLVFATLTAILFGALMLHPYPRQKMFGPKFNDTPLCVWLQDARRHFADERQNPNPGNSIFERFLAWVNKGREPLVWRLPTSELATIYSELMDDPDTDTKTMEAVFSSIAKRDEL